MKGENKQIAKTMRKTGIDALDLLKKISPVAWKKKVCVVFDPPYYDEEDSEKVNQRSKMKNREVAWNKQYTRIMDKEHRENILNYIRNRINGHIIHFHTLRERIQVDNIACEHIWVKPIHNTLAGNNDRNNGEYIVIEGSKIEGKKKGRVINKYINAGFKVIPRACAKPLYLYVELFRHIKPDLIIDPFVGFGNSIYASEKLGIPIIAGDLDSSLKWDRTMKLEEFI